jgi:ubiquinone/menaquinone biosynthesis C-methylase UbiE
MPHYRDVAAFDARASHYDSGLSGGLHHQVCDRTAHLAILAAARPNRVLDVGCGTGHLLRKLASHYKDAEEFVGIDASPRMVEVATSLATDQRLRYVVGVAEQLPFPDGGIDLIVSTTSFDHWSDQQAGLVECARVLSPGGHLVLVDMFSWWLTPTLVASRRGKARTKQRANGLLVQAGFNNPEWHNVYPMIFKAVTVIKPV